MLRGLRTVTYAVEDLPAAKAWYSQVLGKAPYFDEPFYVGFDVGGYELGFHLPGEHDAGGAGSASALWEVDDVTAAIGQLVALGATPRHPARDVGGDIVVGTVLDPFGNALGLIRNPNFAPPLVTAVDGDRSDRAIVREAVVARSPAAAWALWTSAEGVAEWWVEDSRIELHPGGAYELRFMADAPRGLRGSEGCRVLSFLPGRMLSFTWSAPPSLPRTRSCRTWVVLTFDAVDVGTRLTLTHLGWPASAWSAADSQWPATFAYFERAWTSVLDRFSAHGADATSATS